MSDHHDPDLFNEDGLCECMCEDCTVEIGTFPNGDTDYACICPECNRELCEIHRTDLERPSVADLQAKLEAALAVANGNCCCLDCMRACLRYALTGETAAHHHGMTT